MQRNYASTRHKISYLLNTIFYHGSVYNNIKLFTKKTTAIIFLQWFNKNHQYQGEHRITKRHSPYLIDLEKAQVQGL